MSTTANNCVKYAGAVLIGLLVLHVGVRAVHVPANDAHLLYHYLLVDENYNKNVRPAANFSNPTYVDMSLTIINIISFDEVSQILAITGKLYVYWTDDYLAWDPADHAGITSMSFPQNEVWKPDITLENSINKYADLGAVSMYVLVTSTGRVKWKPLEVFQSKCGSDPTYFPVDVQTCCLHFESWSHISGTVLIRNADDIVKLYGHNSHPEWEIIETQSFTRIEGHDLYVTFCITLKRKYLYVLLNIVMPVSFLSVLSLFVFTLPVESGEKASFTVTVFLSLAVFLTIVSGQLPKTSEHVSLFNVYVFVEVLLSTLITILTLLQMRLYHREEKRRVPAWLQKVVKYRICFCARTVTESSVNNCDYVKSVNINRGESVNSEPDPDKNVDTVNWKHVAKWIGTFLFWTFLLINFVFTTTILVCIMVG